MLKIIKWALGMGFCLYPLHQLLCYNPQLLDSHTDLFNEYIWSKAPISKKLIQGKLDFLDAKDDDYIQQYNKNNILEKYKGKIDGIQDERFKKFFGKCKKIHADCVEIDPFTQAAVQMLFEKVFQKYEEQSLWEEHFGFFVCKTGWVSPNPRENGLLLQDMKELNLSDNALCLSTEREKSLISKIISDINILINYSSDTENHQQDRTYYKEIRLKLFESIHALIYGRVWTAEDTLESLRAGISSGSPFDKFATQQESELNDFYNNKPIQNFLNLIYTRYPGLKNKKPDLYSNHDGAQFFPVTIMKSPYVPVILDLIPHLYTVEWEDLSQFLSKKQEIEKIKKNQEEIMNLLWVRQYIRYVTEIPLVLLQSTNVDDLIEQYKDRRLPGQSALVWNPVTFGDIHRYLALNLMQLGWSIENLSPNLRKISPDKMKSALSKSSILENQAIIFYNSLPLNSLALIQKFLMEEGKKSKENRVPIPPLLIDAAYDIALEFKILKKTVDNLIHILVDQKSIENFSLGDISSFSNIHMLGDHVTDRLYLEKLVSTLESFVSGQQNVSQNPNFHLWIRYAVLRSLVTLGEASKEITYPRFNKKNDFSRSVEEIRDILAHPEKYPYASIRLKEFVEQNPDNIFDSIISAYLNLYQIFQKDLNSLNSLQNWKEIKDFYISELLLDSTLFQPIIYLRRHLQSRLGVKAKQELLETFDRRKKESINHLDEIRNKLIQGLSNSFSGNEISAIRQEITGLSLPEFKKKELRESTNFFKDQNTKKEKRLINIKNILDPFTKLENHALNTNLDYLKNAFHSDKHYDESDFKNALERLPGLSSEKKKLEELYKCKIAPFQIIKLQPDVDAYLETLPTEQKDKLISFIQDDQASIQHRPSFEKTLKGINLFEEQKEKIRTFFLFKIKPGFSDQDLNQALNLLNTIGNILSNAFDAATFLSKIEKTISLNEEQIEENINILPLIKKEKQILKQNFSELNIENLLNEEVKKITIILDLMLNYIEDETAMVKITEFIEHIAYPRDEMPPKEAVKNELDLLGLQQEDKEKWLKHFNFIHDTKKETSNPEESQFKKIKKKIQRFTKQMLHTLERLHIITSDHRNYRDPNCSLEFCKNDFLYYACEYLSGTLRNQAIILEDKIRFLKDYDNLTYNTNGYNIIFSRLETQLSNLIKKGNDIFHLHDVTTSGIQTEEERRSSLLRGIIFLLDETPLEEGFLPSLRYNLNLIKDWPLNNIEN